MKRSVTRWQPGSGGGTLSWVTEVGVRDHLHRCGSEAGTLTEWYLQEAGSIPGPDGARGRGRHEPAGRLRRGWQDSNCGLWPGVPLGQPALQGRSGGDAYPRAPLLARSDLLPLPRKGQSNGWTKGKAFRRMQNPEGALPGPRAVAEGWGVEGQPLASVQHQCRLGWL